MTQQDEFANPGGGGDLIDFNTLKGSLLVFEVVAVEPNIPTVHSKPGELTPAIRCDVFVLDGEHQGEENTDTLIFPLVLQSQLKRHVGGRVLGRLSQGEKKPGKNAPWQLTEASDADQATARAWSAARKPMASASAPSGSEPPF